MHVGLVKIENNRVVRVQYVDSKWERELGDIMRVDGFEMRVGVIADSRNSVIETLNGFIRRENKIIRRENKIARRENEIANAAANAEFAEIMRKIVKDALSY
jgi:hypothetical protein